MNKTFTTLLAATALGVSASFVSVTPALAQKAEIYTGRFSSLAVGGYDAVSFFSEQGPAKGSKDFSYSYKGATWMFQSRENLNAFIATPEAYAPQYGGYCAWALAQNKLAKGDPRYWSLVDGKLYLNYNKKIQNDWLKDTDGFILKGDENWPAVLNQ